MIRFTIALATAFFLQFALPHAAADETRSASASEESSSSADDSSINDFKVQIQLVPNIVGRVQQIRGLTNANGVPVVLVRSDQDNEPWWIQGVPIRSKNQFAAKALFGNARSIPGTRFRVCAIVVEPNVAYRTGQVLKTLPNVAKSDDLIVTLLGGDRYIVGKDTGQADKRSIEFTSPRLNSDVSQIVDLKGKSTKSVTPVVLIRLLTEGSVWWIQDDVKLTRTGTFSLKVVVGNKSTPEGTRFRVIALAVPHKNDLAQFKAGEFLKKLPKDIQSSRELLVTLRRDTGSASKTRTASKAPEPAATK